MTTNTDIARRPKRTRVNSEIQRFCFSDIFNGLKSHQLLALRRLYDECHGELPARRVISATAKSIGLSQARVRRWFGEEREMRSKESEASFSMSSDSASYDGFLHEGLWTPPGDMQLLEKLQETLRSTDRHILAMDESMKHINRALAMIEEGLFQSP